MQGRLEEPNIWRKIWKIFRDELRIFSCLLMGACDNFECHLEFENLGFLERENQ